MSSFKIVIMGFGKMPADCTNILLSQDVPVQCVWETEQGSLPTLGGLCARFNIPFENPTRARTTELLNALTGPTVVFSINNNYLFPEMILEKENLRIINFHNSLLPSYPGHGRSTSTWAIFNGESRHGVTWHLVNAGIDNGDILCQEAFAISETDTALKVMMRAISLGTDIFSRQWKAFVSPECAGRPQGATQGRIYRSCDIPNNGRIDRSWDFVTMGRFLRSMDYGPFQLMPSPKFGMDKEEYVVHRYEIDRETRSGKQDMRFHRASEGRLAQAECMYEQGTITLFLRKEAEYA